MAKAVVIRTSGTVGDQLRAELVAKKAAFGDELADVMEAGERLSDLVDVFTEKVQSDRNSGELTDVGLQARRRSHGEPVVLAAERMEARAQQLERLADTTFEQAWSALISPAKDVLEDRRFERVQRLLQNEDVLLVEQHLLHAARTGQDEFLRAALTWPAPPLGDLGTWKAIVPDGLKAALQQVIRERVGPQGADAWRVRELRSMAAFAKTIVLGLTS